MPFISFLQVRAHPTLHIPNLREWISRNRLDRLELCEAYSEAHIIGVVFHEIIRLPIRELRRVDEELEESLAGQSPPFLVPLHKSLAVCEDFSE